MYGKTDDSTNEQRGNPASYADYAPTAAASSSVPEPLGKVPAYNLPQRRTPTGAASAQHPSYGYGYQENYATAGAATPNVYAPYGYGTATGGTRAEAATKATPQQHKAPLHYSHNGVVAVCILPLLGLTLASHESAYPTMTFSSCYCLSTPWTCPINAMPSFTRLGSSFPS